MNFLEPWGLAGLAALIPIVALYFLKLKREERVVPSTLLWKKVIDDMQVNSPFQRLKTSLLLILQLLLIALLGFALARPYLSLSGYAGSKTILLIDTSASMSTKDGDDSGRTRLEAAIKDAQTKADDLKHNDEMMLVAFDRDVRQLSKFSNDRGMLKTILANLQTRDVITRASEAFENAVALCEGHRDVKVLVLSDGCFDSLKMIKDKNADVQRGNIEDNAARGEAAQTPLERLAQRLSNFRFVSYGSDTSDNVGITQIDARTSPVKATNDQGVRIDAVETQIFIMVENFSPQPKNVVLSLSTPDQNFSPKSTSLKGRLERQETLLGTPGEGHTSDASRSVEVFKLPLGTRGVVRAEIISPKDKFPLDDAAHVVVGSSEGINLLFVTKDNFFVEKALDAMRGLKITKMHPDEFSKLWDKSSQQAVDAYDACIFEETAPLAWTEGGALFLGAMPPLPGFVKAPEPLKWPRVIDWDISHPAMRYVNFSNITVAKSQEWKVPKTAKTIVEGERGPMVVAFENDRLRVIGVSFDIFSSDWVYKRSLPLFLRNAIPWLAESSPRRHPTALRTGDPLVIPPTLGATSATLQRPGQGPELVQLSLESGTLIKGTEKTGLYHLKGMAAEGRVYALNLASRTESENAARGSLNVEGKTIDSTRSSIEAKREIWKDLALVAGVLLLIEWWAFHRRLDYGDWSALDLMPAMALCALVLSHLSISQTVENRGLHLAMMGVALVLFGSYAALAYRQQRVIRERCMKSFSLRMWHCLGMIGFGTGMVVEAAWHSLSNTDPLFRLGMALVAVLGAGLIYFGIRLLTSTATPLKSPARAIGI